MVLVALLNYSTNTMRPGKYIKFKACVLYKWQILFNEHIDTMYSNIHAFDALLGFVNDTKDD